MDAKVQIHGIVAKHISDVSGQLVLFLERILPSIFDDWWSKAVVNTLSMQQKKRLEQNNINTLGGLDLAGLLRVLDQNWFQISNSLNLTPDVRHFVKEMSTVRNRWAHADSFGVIVEDVYRDLDTLQRFAVVIGADDAVIQDLKATKSALLAAPPQSHADDHSAKPLDLPEEKKDKVEFEPGQLVVVKSSPTTWGAVVGVQLGEKENRFQVFIDGSIHTLYASQLRGVVEKETVDFLPCEQFHAYLTALQIKYPGLTTLYSLNAARVDFIPYQFRPVLRFIRSDRPRLLIADGVGVGKTIEAGLILRELQARREIRSVLIICPRPLVTEQKWKNEMKRFEEHFTHLDGPALRYCVNEMDLEGVWPDQHQKTILPYSLFDDALLYGSAPKGKHKPQKGLLDLDPPPRFDLVIVDEAHHIRNQSTSRHKAVKFFCDHAEAVVFLTATPVQLGTNDLFVLLNTLRPDLIIDQESFTHMAEPNPFINQAVSVIRSQKPEWKDLALDALDKAAATSWGNAILRHNPDFNRVRSKLTENHISQEDRVRMISDTESMHTFAGIINRTLRRDIGNFTIRKPETVSVPFTPAQQHLHDILLQIQEEIFSQIHCGINIKFMMTTIRRQAASCIFGLAPFLENILTRHVDELSWPEVDDDTDFPDTKDIIPIQTQIQTLLKATSSLETNDPKLDALRNIIRDKQRLQNNKVMLFSSFRHTLSYIFNHLSYDGFRVGLIHGGTPDEQRVELRARFEKPREDGDCLDLLLFSEIGCEGLDYQFCDCIVNYDLPWNPMRIEQRIGRIDRNGQKSESVAIINLITPGTVDADIYDRCLMRIGVFNNAVGGSEEILGEITREIKNIAENYELSEEDRQKKLDQLADNKIGLMQEQEELEKAQVELFGIRLPPEQMDREIANVASFWLSTASIIRLVTLYLQRVCGKTSEFLLGDKSLKTLRLAQDFRSKLLDDFLQLPKQNTAVYREWENWLKGGNPHLSITFESDCAKKHPEAAFIMPLHPLVKQASLSFDEKQRIITNLEVTSNEVPAGQYEFAIYQWRFHGIREDLVFKPIASTVSLTEYIGRLLETARDASNRLPIEPDLSVWDGLDEQHYLLWRDARIQHQQKTQELAEYRRESLSISHRARMVHLEEQLEQLTNEKIQKIRQYQITTAEADYARRIQELDIAIERADIVSGAVAYGVIHVQKELS